MENLSWAYTKGIHGFILLGAVRFNLKSGLKLFWKTSVESITVCDVMMLDETNVTLKMNVTKQR